MGLIVKNILQLCLALVVNDVLTNALKQYEYCTDLAHQVHCCFKAHGSGFWGMLKHKCVIFEETSNRPVSKPPHDGMEPGGMHVDRVKVRCSCLT